MLATCKGVVKNPALGVFAYHEVETFQSGISERRHVDNLKVTWNIYLSSKALQSAKAAFLILPKVFGKAISFRFSQ